MYVNMYIYIYITLNPKALNKNIYIYIYIILQSSSCFGGGGVIMQTDIPSLDMISSLQVCTGLSIRQVEARWLT